VLDTVIVSQPELNQVEEILTEDHDVSGVIVECHGAHWGMFPLQNPNFLQGLKDITEKHGVVFIMDEVVTGFRLSSGGAHMRWGIDPDITTMAKIIAGGQHGAAVGGKLDIIELMAFRNDTNWNNYGRVAQGGTYNAQPITAVAGIATLNVIAEQDVNRRADEMARRLKNGLNEAFIKNEVVGHAHGISSIVHLNLGSDCNCDRGICTMPYDQIYRTMTDSTNKSVRWAMLVNGVDLMGGRGFLVSSAHDEQVIDHTIEAFSQSLKDLREECVV